MASIVTVTARGRHLRRGSILASLPVFLIIVTSKLSGYAGNRIGSATAPHRSVETIIVASCKQTVSAGCHCV